MKPRMTVERVRWLPFLLGALLLCQSGLPGAVSGADEPTLTFSIGSDVSTDDEITVREGAQLARDYVSEHLSPLNRDQIIINVRNSNDSTGGHAIAFSGGDYIVVFTRSSSWRRIAPFDQIRIVVHEYVHSWQASLSGDNRGKLPLWLVEGSAEFLAFDAVVREGLVREQEVHDDQAWGVLGAGTMAPLQDLESWDAFYNEPGPTYDLAWLAVSHLLRDGSSSQLVRFFEIAGSGVDWEEAFVRAFDEEVDTFYRTFARARKELIGPRNSPEPFALVEPTFLESPLVLGAVAGEMAIGEQVTIVGQSVPGATCSLRIRSETSGERLNRNTVTDGAGRLFWLVTLPPEFGTGPAVLAANCGGASIENEKTVTAA